VYREDIQTGFAYTLFNASGILGQNR